MTAAIASRGDWMRLLGGLTLAYAMFQVAAHALGSDRGQAGVVVAALVVGVLLLLERSLFRQSGAEAWRALGFARPAGRGLATAAALVITLWFVLLIYGSATATRFTMLSGWYWLVPGLFAQAGVAEEALFRAYLFGHLRTSRTFWRATAIALLPFVAVHLTMFVTMPWPIALAGVALSVASVPPFAWLYELDGHTVWAPALLHAVIQGTVKVVIPDGASSSFVLAWMVASAIVPWAALLVRGAAPATGAGSHPVRTGVPGATSPALRQRVS